MKNLQEPYKIKMLNGLVVDGLSKQQVKDGITKGKYLPSDFILNDQEEWINLKNTGFIKNYCNKINLWMALFGVSFILNIVMLLLMFWQNSRIEKLLD